MPLKSDFENALRGASLRVTRPRLAVLTAVQAHPHADTDTVIRVVRQDLGAVSHQAVYGVLHALTAAGLLRRIEPAGSVARYESRVGDNHHHVVCRRCSAIADVDSAGSRVGSVVDGSGVEGAPCLTASRDHGFVIDQTEVLFWGLCHNCSTAPSTVQPAPDHPLLHLSSEGPS